MIDRAAQFSPFAALTGHQDAVMETQRLTEDQIDLDEECKMLLNQKLQMLQERLLEKPEITLTYFQPDEKKTGGKVLQCSGTVKKIDEIEHLLLMTDGTKIPMEHLYEISGEIFAQKFVP